MNVRTQFLNLFVVVGLSAVAAAVNGQQAASDVWKTLIGQRAPVSVVTPATGPWAERHPFDPAKFGLTRGFSPGGSPGIMIYARSLTPRVLDVAARLDAIVADNEKLQLSCLHVLDRKGAQQGGYTAAEVAERIQELKTLAADHDITHLSIGIAANGSDGHAAKVGIDSTHDLVIVVMTENAAPKKASLVSWYRAVSTSELMDSDLNQLAESLRDATARPPESDSKPMNP